MPDSLKSVKSDSFGPLHLWEFAGHRWVRAESEEHARDLLKREEGDGSMPLVKQWRDDEPFTMAYEDRDAMPTGAIPDDECDCDARNNHTTMPAGWWANCQSEAWVIYEPNW